MKIIQIVPFIGAESSGPAYCLPNLCRALSNAGADVDLFTLAEVPETIQDISVKAFKRSFFPHPALGRSPEMLKQLIADSKHAHIIHNNSLWMMPNIYPGIAHKHNPSSKFVLSPHGTLATWALKHHSIQKKIIGLWGQYKTLKQVDMFHATCEKEYNEIRQTGFHQPVAVIPIGMDFVDVVPQKNNEKKTLLFFGRIHTVKGGSNLLKAWQMIQERFPDWNLVFVGPDGGDLPRLKEQCEQGRIPRVSFIGEVNGQQKYQLLADADLYILPSFTENFGITVAEALATGVPVIVSTGTPWRDVEKNECGSWVSNAPESLAAALSHWMGLSPEERQSAGAKGKEWIRRSFSWTTIGSQMLQAYQWLLGEREKPEWVIAE